jgi:hypothetical protein
MTQDNQLKLQSRKVSLEITLEERLVYEALHRFLCTIPKSNSLLRAKVFEDMARMMNHVLLITNQECLNVINNPEIVDPLILQKLKQESGTKLAWIFGKLVESRCEKHQRKMDSSPVRIVICSAHSELLSLIFTASKLWKFQGSVNCIFHIFGSEVSNLENVDVDIILLHIKDISRNDVVQSGISNVQHLVFCEPDIKPGISDLATFYCTKDRSFLDLNIWNLVTGFFDANGQFSGPEIAFEKRAAKNTQSVKPNSILSHNEPCKVW